MIDPKTIHSNAEKDAKTIDFCVGFDVATVVPSAALLDFCVGFDVAAVAPSTALVDRRGCFLAPCVICDEHLSNHGVN